MPGIEAFNLVDAGAGVLGQVEDVDLAMAKDDPHAYGGVPEAVDASIGFGHGIMLQSGAIQQQIKLPLKDASCCCAIGVVGQKDVIVSASIRITLA